VLYFLHPQPLRVPPHILATTNFGLPVSIRGYNKLLRDKSAGGAANNGSS
jgi:hypothetical protein